MCVKLTIASQFLQTRHITLEQWDTSVEVSDHVFGVESIYPSIYPSIHPSIHPSIFFRLSRAGSRGQLPEPGHPDFPLPRHFIQLFWEYPKAFAGQLSNTVTPVCPGSSSGSPPGGTCQEHLPREASRGHLKQMPEPPQLAPRDVEEQRLYSKLLPGDRAPHPISKGAPTTLRRNLISATCIRDLILSVMTQSSWS